MATDSKQKPTIEVQILKRLESIGEKMDGMIMFLLLQDAERKRRKAVRK